MEATIDKCLAFCQALVSSNQKFNFTLSIGKEIFKFNNQELVASSCVKSKKKKSPCQIRREDRRREARKLKIAEQVVEVPHSATPQQAAEKTAVTVDSLSPKCNHCDYIAASEKGLKQHIRMKHRETQLDSRLPSTPESLREPLVLRNSLVMSPIAATNRDETDENPYKCWAPVDGCDETFNCEEDLKNHIDYDHSSTICHNCKEEFWEQDYEACPACSCVWP